MRLERTAFGFGGQRSIQLSYGRRGKRPYQETGANGDLTAPFLDSVEEVDVRLRAAEKEASASSRDLQVVRTQVAVQYSMTGPVMPLTFQKIGTRRMVEGTLINPALIQLRIAEKWDGQLPQVNGGGAVPLLNIDSAGKGVRTHWAVDVFRHSCAAIG